MKYLEKLSSLLSNPNIKEKDIEKLLMSSAKVGLYDPYDVFFKINKVHEDDRILYSDNDIRRDTFNITSIKSIAEAYIPKGENMVLDKILLSGVDIEESSIIVKIDVKMKTLIKEETSENDITEENSNAKE